MLFIFAFNFKMGAVLVISLLSIILISNILLSVILFINIRMSVILLTSVILIVNFLLSVILQSATVVCGILLCFNRLIVVLPKVFMFSSILQSVFLFCIV
jgi:hypothetical protein